MTAVTECVVALPHGSASAGVDSPPVRRTRVRARVADTPRSHKVRAATSRVRRVVRNTAEVAYLDAADGFILNSRSQTIREVVATDYAAASPLRDYRPFRVWCRVWKPVAVTVVTGVDTAKFLLVHPVRGPLTLTAVAVGAVIANH